MDTNRIVVLLTPVFAALSGALVAWVADNVPGAPKLDQGELTAAFVAGASVATAVAGQWLRGWQKHEERRGR